jgi:23S rRNA (pseudouridine1915-N3)-methyltransferase
VGIKIIAVGNIKESYLREGIQENIKKLSSKFDIDMIEINEYRLGQNPSETEIKKGLEAESEAILNYIDNRSYLIVCDIDGKVISSTSLKKVINNQIYNYKRDVVFVIGSSFGLDDNIKRKANLKLSFSKMTFPHQLMRLLLINHLSNILL